MKLTVKNYKIVRTKKYLKANDLFFFINGINRNSLDWLVTEQGLKTVGFGYYKILNNTSVKTLNASIYIHISSVIKGSTILVNPLKINKKSFLKQTVLNTFNPLFFELLMLKFNNKIYSVNSLKSTYSLEYKETKLLLYHFSLAHLKTYYKFSK